MGQLALDSALELVAGKKVPASSFRTRADDQGQRRRRSSPSIRSNPGARSSRRRHRSACAPTPVVRCLRRRRQGVLGRSQVLHGVDLDRARGRGGGAAGRKRRRQVHPLLHHRRPRAADAGRMTWEGAAYAPASPGRRAGGGHRPDPSGDAAAAGPLDRRERVRRPPADARRPRRSRGDEPPRAPSSCTASASTCRRPAGARPARRRAAAGRDRQGADAERAPADLRRADRGARRRGDRAPVRADRPAEAGRRVASSTSATGSTRSLASPTASWCCATASWWQRTRPRRCRWTLVRDMVGRPLDRMFPHDRAARRQEVLRVEGLTSADRRFSDVSFSVRAGEMFGVAGIVGAGRTELMRAIAGRRPDRRGHDRRSTAGGSRPHGPADGDPRRHRAGARGPQGAGPDAGAYDRRQPGARQLSDRLGAARLDVRRRAVARFARTRYRAVRHQGTAGPARAITSPAATSRRW